MVRESTLHQITTSSLPKLAPNAFLCSQALQFAKHKSGLLRVAIHERVLIYLLAFLYNLTDE